MLDPSAGGALFAQLGFVVVIGFLVRKLLDGVLRQDGLAEQLRHLLNRVVLWVTMPALVFQTVHAAPLGRDLIQAPAAAIAGMAGTAALAWLLLARLYGRTPETGGLVLAASAGSVSFFGIPIVRALFGPDETRVAVYFAVLNVPLALLAGAVISSRLAQSRGAARSYGLISLAHIAVRQFFTLPVTWALFGALALRTVTVPAIVDGALNAWAMSVAPTTMFALGLGLRFERSLAPYRMALPAVAIKLAISPVVVFVCAWAIGLSGLPLAAVALQGAMPTQVLSVVVAERFRLNSRLVGLTLAMDTAVAFFFLPFVVRVLRAGIGA